jgi:formate/nitrite transporter FocA (FNT family)
MSKTKQINNQKPTEIITKTQKVDWLEVAIKSLTAGMLIGIAVTMTIVVSNKYLSSCLFAFALLLIKEKQVFLYTGRVGSYSWLHRMPEILVILIGNLAGIQVIKAIAHFAGVLDGFTAPEPPTYFKALFLAILCGALMDIGVKTKSELVTVFCIMIFILSGFKHSIAESYKIYDPIILIYILGNALGGKASHVFLTYKNPPVK